MRSRTIALMLFLGVWGIQATAQRTDSAQTRYFTARQAVDFAMANAIAVKNALLDIEAQRQMNKQVTASALPQITGNVSLTDYLSLPTSLIPAEFFGGTPGTYEPIKFGTKYNGTYGGDLQQVLFDGQVFAGLQARKTSIDYYMKQKEVTEDQIKANVYKVYYQLVVGERQIGTIDANIGNYEKLLHDTREIYKNGFAEKLDVDKVQVQLSNLYTQRDKAQNQIDAGLEGLKFLMHVPQKDSLVLTDTLSDDEIKANILDESYSYDDRKDYQLLGLYSKLQGYNIKRYQLSRIPTLTFDANIAQNAQRETFDFFKAGGQFFTTSFISLRLSVPIFSGFAKNAEVAQARIAWQKAQNNLDQMKASIDNDVSQARLSMKSAITTMDSQKKNTDLAESVYNATKLKYEQGVGSNQEINQAEADLVTAQNSYYQALYDAIIAKVDYLQATGKL